MNSILDSSVSSYSQLQRITNAENENTEVTGEEEAKKPVNINAVRNLF